MCSSCHLMPISVNRSNLIPSSRDALTSFVDFIRFRARRSRGGDDGIRTHDPLLAGQVLSQLSYTPICGYLVPEN